MPRRSVLFTPADSPDMLRSAPETGADVLVFDLEDGVGPADKDDARDVLRDVVPGIEFDGELWLRVNDRDDLLEADTTLLREAGVAAALDGVVVPKVTGPGTVERVTDRYPADVAPPVLALVENARGVLGAEAIADASAVGALLFGGEDLAGDVGMTRTEGNEELLYARQRTALAAAAAGVDAIDGIYTDIYDTEGLRTEAETALEFGYDGKTLIHPGQVAPVNDVFTPTEEAVEWARRVTEAAAEREAGVFTLDGELIEAPIRKQAERVLERAGER
ncbi:MAG: citrate lyase subunit beta/citryl-CoA lyase [Natronomonas sp.]|jgi:citrate lyase subunit beta/citryl-CoA lyase